MGIKITDIIGEFSTNDEYQIVDVTQISKKGIKKSLRVVFQRLDAGELVREIKFIDVAYARLMVIGTIWKNKKKVQLPSFFERYQAFNLNFSALDVSNKQFEFEEFGSDYINEIKKNRKESSYNLITYNVALRLARKENGITKLFKTDSKEKNQNLVEFVSFFPHEFLRFFLTSNEIGDLNDIFFGYNNVKGKWKDENGVLNPKESIKKKDEFNVYLQHNKYQNDSDLIGDTIYIHSIKTVLFSIQNFLNAGNYFYLSGINKAPIKSCKRLTFSGLSITRKTDGAKGLLVFLIEECTSYRPNEYTVTLTRTENKDDGSGENKTPIPTGKSGGSSNNENLTPVVTRNSKNTNKEHEIDESGLEFLLKSKPPSKIKYETVINQGGGPKIPIEDEDNDIGDPSDTGEPGGKKPKLPDPIEHTLYFKFYKEIIDGIQKKLERLNYICSIDHIDKSKLWSNEALYIERAIFNVQVTNPTIENRLMYITQLHVKAGIKKGYFYLFEMDNGTRTLLYAKVGFAQLNENDIAECLKYFPGSGNSKKNPNKEKLEGKIVKYLNHLQSKKTNKKYEEGKLVSYDNVPISKEDAINKHVGRISDAIIEGLR